MQEEARTCGCGCGEKFTPKKPWQRFKSETCRNRYHGTRRDRLRKEESEVVKALRRIHAESGEALSRFQLDADGDFVDTKEKGNGVQT